MTSNTKNLDLEKRESEIEGFKYEGILGMRFSTNTLGAQDEDEGGEEEFDIYAHVENVR